MYMLNMTIYCFLKWPRHCLSEFRIEAEIFENSFLQFFEWLKLYFGQFDSTEFTASAESTESAENRNPFFVDKTAEELSLNLLWYLFTDPLSQK